MRGGERKPYIGQNKALRPRCVPVVTDVAKPNKTGRFF
jgi:hypothetical protein